MFKRIVHKLRPDKCVKEATWERGELHCPCGEILALRYSINDIPRIFVYPEFAQYKQEITASQQYIENDEVIGAICFDDFNAFMEEMKRTPLNTYVPDEEIGCDEEEIEEDTYLG